MALCRRNIHYVVVKIIIVLLLSTTSVYSEENYSWSIDKINESNVMVSKNDHIHYGVSFVDSKTIDLKTFNCFDYPDLMKDGVCWCGTEAFLHIKFHHLRM